MGHSPHEDDLRTYVDLSVEAAGPHQSWVQDVGAVGTSQHDHIGAGVEPCRDTERPAAEVLGSRF